MIAFADTTANAPAASSAASSAAPSAASAAPTPSATAPTPRPRLYFADNVKGICIILVVIGHVLESCYLATDTANSLRNLIYLLIYAFHMPTFALVTGALAKPNAWSKKGLSGTLWLVGIFLAASILQTIVQFAFFSPDAGWKCIHTWTTLRAPHTLWWLMALAIWRNVLPLANRIRRACESWIPAFAISFALLAAGHAFVQDPELLTIMRTLHFWPFFLVGHVFFQKFWGAEKSEAVHETPGWPRTMVRIARVAFPAILIILAIAFAPNCTNSIQPLADYVYGRMPITRIMSYGAGFESIAIYVALWCASCALALSLMLITPNKPSWLGTAGKYSLNIYILHILLIKIMVSPVLCDVVPWPIVGGPIAMLAVQAVLIGLCAYSPATPVISKAFALLKPNFR